MTPPHHGKITIRNTGRLPHWDIEGGTYFVTFRLFDSLPESVVASVNGERRRMESQIRIRGEVLDQAKLRQISATINKQVEKALDQGQGCCILARPEIAEIVTESIRFFHGDRYTLYAWCVMPNHVHVVFKLLADHTLSELMHSWKSFTANKINEALERDGPIWEREYFDRTIRDDKHLVRAMRYVGNNPVKAGLVDWRWVWMRD